jgi:Spy/CpxP family protein refolding chaperone
MTLRKSCACALAILGSVTLLFACLASAQDEQARNHFLHALGGPFFVSRDVVQEDLKLSDDQKQKLRKFMIGYIQEAMTVQKLSGREREQAMKSLREKSFEKLEAYLKEILTSEQLTRFEQLKLQYDVPSIFLGPQVEKELKITNEQRQQFMGAIQQMQQQIQPLLQEAKTGGNPQAILPKVIKLRRECEATIKTYLTDTQKRQWEEMTGTRLDIW